MGDHAAVMLDAMQERLAARHAAASLPPATMKPTVGQTSHVVDPSGTVRRSDLLAAPRNMDRRQKKAWVGQQAAR